MSARLSRVSLRSVSNSLQIKRRCYSVPAGEDYDIVIVGGGPAGLALASALGSSRDIKDRLRIALIEGRDLSKIQNWSMTPDTYSNRVSSLTNASQTFLSNIGAWSYIEEDRTCPVEDMEVWDGVSDARISFHASDIVSSPNPQMSRLTENLNLQKALIRHLRTDTKVDVIDKTRVEGIYSDEGNGDWPLLKLANDRLLRARLLVGADGFNSPVRAYANIPSFGWSYNTQAIVATMFHSPPYHSPRHTTAYQRFLPTGPIAFLPLSPTASSLVWSINPPELAQTLVASDPSLVVSMINAAFRLPSVSMKYLYGVLMEAKNKGLPLDGELIRKEISWREKSHGIDETSAYASGSSSQALRGVPPLDADMLPPLVRSIQPGTVASFPLKFNHAEAYLGEGRRGRTVLVGDAAHTVHPLAGQGLNLGLADVECLSRCIRNAVINGGDVGSYTALFPYAQERYLANHTVMSAVDKLHKIYTTDVEPVVWARSVGVEILNELDVLKGAMMMAAGAGTTTISGTPSTGWALAASGIQAYSSAVQTMNTVSKIATGLLGQGLQNLGQQLRK